MVMVLNEEQRMLQETSRDFLRNNAPVAAMRALRDSKDSLGYSPKLWLDMTELGVTAIVMPKEYGGLGFGYLGLGALLEEMGRNLSASPLFATMVLGGSIIQLGENEALREQLLPEISVGTLTLALAIDEGCHHRPLQTTCRLTAVGSGYVLDGEKTFVLDGHSADKLAVVARSSGIAGDSVGLDIVMVDRDSKGITVKKTHLMDGRNAASIHFNQVSVDEAALISEPGQAWKILDQVLNRGVICTAAEMLGGILELFERTMTYLNEREQFNVKIGSFQALQHRSAALFCEIEHCKSVVLDALSAIDQSAVDLSERASLAKTLVNDCYQRVSNEAIQMHGGMGITDDLEIGLFLKRARVCAQILGDSNYHSDRYATLKGY